MNFALTDEEWTLLASIPVSDVVDLAVTLDLAPPSEIGRRELFDACVPRIVAFVEVHGLPLSKYDADDLHELSGAERTALAELAGLSSRSEVRHLIKAGEKVYKTLQKEREDHPVAYMLPILLRPLVRFARHHR